MLFSDRRHHTITIPAHSSDGKPVTIAHLIHHLCEDVMKDSRKEMFVLDDHMYVAPPSFCCCCFCRPSVEGDAKSFCIPAHSRPGILVLINDADWELEGEEAYEIKSGDNILFVSTLHGG